jgi:hypothetical protein
MTADGSAVLHRQSNRFRGLAPASCCRHDADRAVLVSHAGLARYLSHPVTWRDHLEVPAVISLAAVRGSSAAERAG